MQTLEKEIFVGCGAVQHDFHFPLLNFVCISLICVFLSFFLSVFACGFLEHLYNTSMHTHLTLSLSLSLTITPLSVCVCSDTCRDLWPGHLTIDIHGCTRIWFLLPIHISLFDKMFTALKANRPILIRSVWLTMIIWPNLRVCSSQNYEMPLMLTYPTIQTVQKDAKKPYRWVTFSYLH